MKYDLKDLLNESKFENWARSAFVNEDYAQNLIKFINHYYGEISPDTIGDDFEKKVIEIVDDIISKYDIDEQVIKELNKIGLSEFQVELNKLEVNTQKLNVLNNLVSKTEELAEALGLSGDENKTTITIEDDEITITNKDEDVKVVSLINREANKKPTKASLDISKTLTYIGKTELLAGTTASIDMPVLLKASDDLWLRGHITNILNEDCVAAERLYTVLLDNGDELNRVTGVNIAGIKNPLEFGKIYPVGTRVTTVYMDENGLSGHYSGIVAEPPAPRNSYRYLIFFDDGYVQYSRQEEIYLIFVQDIFNWKLMREDLHDFICKYLNDYPERAMVKMRVGQFVNIELNGYIRQAMVEKLDASVAYVSFSNLPKGASPTGSSTHQEWIYRGSPRIEVLHQNLKNKEEQKLSSNPGSSKMFKRPNTSSELGRSNSKRKRLVPDLSDTNGVKTSSNIDNQYELSSNKKARKSTTTNVNLSSSKNQHTNPSATPYINIGISDIESAGTFTTTLDKVLETRIFPRIASQPHTVCDKNCLPANLQSDPQHLKGSNPLEIPILAGWFRVKTVPNKKTEFKSNGKKINKSSKNQVPAAIYYVGPCGRHIRSMIEVENYLVMTESLLSIDYFSFETELRVNREFQVHKSITSIMDISYGKENVPVPCVNGVDNDVPPYIDYMPNRHIMDPSNCSTLLPLPADRPELKPFLSCCDCTDGCKNKAKCACQQMTLEMASAILRNSNNDPDMRLSSMNGFNFKRLYNYHPGGIFECNSQCSCAKQINTCRNRVVQGGLMNKLQIFKTERKGWGIRTLHDIPRGAFVCTYAGTIYDEMTAVQEGHKFGDEYQAELDFIEIIEETKEGYESDVVDPEDDDDDKKKKTDVAENDEEKDDEEDERNSNDAAKALLLADSDSDDSSDGNISDQESKSGIKKNPQPPLVSSTENQKQNDTNDQCMNDDDDDSGSGSCCIVSIDTNEDVQPIIIDVDKKKPQSSISTQKPQEMSNNLVLSKVEGNVGQTNLEHFSKSGSRRHTGGQMRKNKEVTVTSSTDIKIDAQKTKDTEKSPQFNIREYLGDPNPFIMDAKRAGNLGRYFNHSCSPNLFVQNVFITSHDLRFPEVAFFAKRNIEAGEEITWDYMYRVGSVPDKVLYCYCGSQECRGRLL